MMFNYTVKVIKALKYIQGIIYKGGKYMKSKYNLKTAYILSSVALFTGAVGFAHSLESEAITDNESSNITASKTETTKKITNENKLSLSSEEEEGGILDSEDLATILKDADESGESLYEGVLPTTNSSYAQSQQSPKVVTTSNWDDVASSFYSDSTDSNLLYKSGKLLLFGIYDNSTRIENENLILEGWSSIINHTHVNGKNNKTYIVLKNGSKVTVVPAATVTNNLTSSWIWNKADPSLRCREQTSDNNKPIAWTADGGTSKTQYKGCYHDNKNIGFKAQIPLETLFGKGEQNSQYSMYVVTSIGGNKILYKPLVSNSTKVDTYSGTTSAGTVTYDAQASNNVASIKSDNDVMIRTSPYESGGTTTAKIHTVVSGDTLWGISQKYNTTVASIKSLNGMSSDTIYVGQKLKVSSTGGSGGGGNTTGATFKKGSYTITNRIVYEGVIWYKLSGQGITGWISSNYVIDKGTPAILRYAVTAQNFNVNFYKQDARTTKVRNSVTKTVNNTSIPSFKITAANEKSLTGTDGKLYSRIIGADQERKFNKDVSPADINLYYDDAVERTVAYVDSATNQVVYTAKLADLQAGQSIAHNVPKHATITANGSTYRVLNDTSATKTFKLGITDAEYANLKAPMRVSVEKQEEVTLAVNHRGVNFRNENFNPIKNLSTENVKVKIYPSDGTKTYKVGAKGISVTGALNNVANTPEMTSGKWRFSNRGIDSDGNAITNPDGTDNVNKGFENITVNSKTGAKSVTFNYMQDKFFYVNYMNQDNKALKVKDSVQQQLTWQKPDFTVTETTDLEIKGTNGLIYYRIYDGNTKTHSRTFNELAAPTDINLFYDNAVDYKIEYKDAQGTVVKSETKTLDAGETITTTVPKNTEFTASNGRKYRNTVAINDTRTFAKALTLTQYNALKNTITINVERQEEITLNIKHNAVNTKNTLISTLNTEALKVNLYPSEGTKTYKVGSKGFGITGALNDVTRTTNMVSGKWFFSGRGIDSDGNVQTNPKGTDPVNKGYEDFKVSSTSVAKSVTFNYMQEQADPNETVKVAPNSQLIAKGQFNWFLTKPNTMTSNATHQESIVELNNIIDVTGSAYARRNGNSTISIPGSTPVTKPETNIHYALNTALQATKYLGNGADTTKVKQVTAENNVVVPTPRKETDFMQVDAEKNLTAAETKNLKGKDVTQEYSFEYTNKYKDIYKPADGYNIGGHVFLYEYTHTNTVWDGSTKVVLKTDANNKLDHNVGDTIALTNDSSTTKNIGRYADIANQTVSKTSPTIKLIETLTEASVINNVTNKTQSTVDIKGNLTYVTNFNANILRGTLKTNHANKDFTYNAKTTADNSYLVKDVDENFRTSTNANGINTLTAAEKTALLGNTTLSTALKTDVNNSGFEIPIKASGTSSVSIETVKDYYVLKNSGLLIETDKLTEAAINEDAKAQYAAFTSGKNVADLTTAEKNAVTDTIANYAATKDLDRYFIPADSASSLKPNTSYNNTYILSGVGLNDTEVVFQDTFKFEDYLVGDVLSPDVKFNTQKEPLVNKGTGYSGQTVITQDTKNEIKEISNENRTKKASNVRTTDSNKVWTQLKSLLKW